jgi:hypothetical protein
MGIGIEAWRQRIGSFPKYAVCLRSLASRMGSFNDCVSAKHVLPCFGPLLFVRLGVTWTALPVVLMLLIRAGIEQNPGPDSTCGLCQKIMNENCHTLACFLCNQCTHFQCVVKENTVRCSTPNRNSGDWLFDFIVHSSFAYICKPCVASRTLSKPNPDTSTPSSMSKQCQTENEISDARETFSSQISTAIDLLSVNVDALYNKVFCSCKDTSVTTMSALCAPKQTAEYSSTWTAVIFSGVPFTSKRDDLSHIQTVMSEIGASARVISSQRFGRRMGNRPQLLRVFLSSRQDADSLLSLANKLRYSTDYVLRRVNITSDRSPAQVAASREQRRVHRSQFRAVQLFLGKTFYRSNKSTRLVSTRSAATCTPCLAMPGVQSSSLPSAASSTTTCAVTLRFISEQQNGNVQQHTCVYSQQGTLSLWYTTC